MPHPKRTVAEAESIYKIETVPPPDGDDAYSATTKVGALSTAQVAALMQGSDEAAPESGVQMRARSASVDDLVPIDVDTAAFAEAPSRAPALLPPALMLATLPIVEASPALQPTSQRAVRSRMAFLAAIAITGFTLFVVAGVWMFVHVVVKP